LRHRAAEGTRQPHRRNPGDRQIVIRVGIYLGDIEHRASDNLEAYQTYLKGLFLWQQRTEAGVNAGIEQFKRAIALDPGNRGHALRTAGALADQHRWAYASPVWIAFLHLGLGDRREAFRWLMQACDNRDGWVRVIKAPFFDNLHGTPEFDRVLGTLGLEVNPARPSRA